MTYLENTGLVDRILYIAEIRFEKLIGYTMGVDIVEGALGEGQCFGITVDHEIH